MQVMGEPATRGRLRERERERERKHAQISEREMLQSKFLLKFSYGKILSNMFSQISYQNTPINAKYLFVFQNNLLSKRSIIKADPVAASGKFQTFA